MTTLPAQLAVPLRGYTTLRLGGPASRFVSATSERELVDAVRGAQPAQEPLLVLGGGSNLVIGDDGFDGTVVHVATRGFDVAKSPSGPPMLTVEAGEDWDEVVARTVTEGYGGLECMSGIPGLVGATPVQNVGAYGVEIADLLYSVDLLDRGTGQVRTVPRDELGLRYRTSSLKNTDSAVVLRIRLGLHADGRSSPVRYPELARALGVPPHSRPPAAEVREAVLELRRSKGMVLDEADHDTWSAGSFFTNPILTADELAEALRRIAERTQDPVPRYPAGAGRTKLPAAWLIERAGFARGHAGPGGRAALSGKHTLALTNRGEATTEDLLALAREVVGGVRDAFGVSLHPEPVLVNCTL
ncbi:MAG TPA: UDP-N-acetylmuramate dehydrogenase [Pseudonocardiaceae bacterium]|nr:UDP-N-acetylmuramate dehydrogenase [Pseudonocardiaceae bacterium]